MRRLSTNARPFFVVRHAAAALKAATTSSELKPISRIKNSSLELSALLGAGRSTAPVSYTHLTLPTILLV